MTLFPLPSFFLSNPPPPIPSPAIAGEGGEPDALRACSERLVALLATLVRLDDKEALVAMLLRLVETPPPHSPSRDRGRGWRAGCASRMLRMTSSLTRYARSS